jgi:Transposase DDE domain group 1
VYDRCYEDASDADRMRHDPALQIIANQKLGEALSSQPTLSRWENAPSARDLVRLNDALLNRFYTHLTQIAGLKVLQLKYRFSFVSCVYSDWNSGSRVGFERREAIRIRNRHQ